MEVFEIHITGSHGINQELDSLGIKNIIVDLLTPEHKFMRTEYMSSFTIQKATYKETKAYVDELVNQLKSKIIRVKIESPYYEHYKDNSLYLESHFKPFNSSFPISMNQRSKSLMATARMYEKDQYEDFKKLWSNEDVEMCLFDSFIEEDKDWFDLYLVN
jgi:hypothetical protein